MENKPKRMLFVSGLPIDKGGIETAIMHVYRGIDREKLLIDFAVRKPEKGCYHDEIESYGGRIFNLFENTEHKGTRKWNTFMDLQFTYNFYKLLRKEGPYCAVHFANPIFDGFAVISAKLARIPTIIVHSHNTGVDDKIQPTWTRVLTRRLRLYLGRVFATHLWGCSNAASIYMFGESIIKDKRLEIVPNPLKIREFINGKVDKETACENLGIPAKKIHLLNIGRFVPQKNQLFLLKVMEEITKIREDIHLILVGSGPLEETIRNHINQNELSGLVTVLDSQSNILEALGAASYFVFPSIYEGFGIVLIEAQASGLACIASDACQPESDVGFIDYIPLEKGPTFWAEYIISKLNNPEIKEIDYKKLMQYETENVAPRMQEVYLEGVRYNEASNSYE